MRESAFGAPARIACAVVAAASLVLAALGPSVVAAAPTGAVPAGPGAAAGQTGGAAAPAAWRASVGVSGAHGMATIRATPAGAVTVELGLLRLRPSTRMTVALVRGTCAKAGVTVVKLPAIVSSTTGGAIRTTSLTKAQASSVRAALKGRGKLVVRVGWAGGSTCGAVEPLVEQSGFLARQGTELLLDGKPYRELSFNKYDLLQQFVVSPDRAWGDNGPNAVAAGEAALRTLELKGFRILRVSASPYSADWFMQAFFDEDPARQAQKRREYFAGFDQALDACDRHGVRLVASLLWQVETMGALGGQPLRAAMTDPDSLGRRRVAEYIRTVVTRYRDRPTIAMWEIGNEYNLVADIQWKQFDVTSDQVAAYAHDTATLVRSIDPNHLITTGDSTPRPSAMHLLQAVRAGKEVDWTPDSAEEQIAYLRLMNADPIDVISIHYYDDGMLTLGGRLGSPENLRFYAQAASEIGKPLLVGEIGLDADVREYTSPASIDRLRATLPVLVELNVPLTFYWTFNDDRTVSESEKYDLRYGKTDAALRLIETAAAEIRR